MHGLIFKPRWREELEVSGPEGTLIFELTMGQMHVYFPDEARWKMLVPAWATKKWNEYHSACSTWCKENRIPMSVVPDAHVYEE